MACKRCPHHVRHGKASKDGKSIVFSDLCGLKIRAIEKPEDPSSKPGPKTSNPPKIVDRPPHPGYGPEVNCQEYPFGDRFEYRLCDTYIEIFKTPGMKNDVMPTKDFLYLDSLNVSSITDMDLL